VTPAGHIATPDTEPWRARVHGSVRAEEVRSSYAVDRDRVIHCDTFRELQHKTQVQAIIGARPSGAFFRTRLNHVIEVAQVARGIATRVGATPDLAESIALAHDLGHAPFGHAGERALSEALREYGESGWNANVHSLAVVERVEAAFVQFRGLDLTWATREGIARHATPFDEPVSFGEFAATPNAGVECQIVDAADVVAYLAHDLDDALSAQYLDIDELASMSDLLADVARIPPSEWAGAPWPEEVHGAIRRRRLVAKLISRVIGDLAGTTEERVEALGVEAPGEVRECGERVVVQSPEYRELTRRLLELLIARYYRSDHVRESDALAARITKGLFAALMSDPGRVPARFDEESVALRVASYTASLNDRSATELAVELGVIEPQPTSVPS
jgi:dGTPase